VSRDDHLWRSNEAKRLALQEKEGQNTRDFMLQMLANMQQQQQQP
jgi:hypothetical protein